VQARHDLESGGVAQEGRDDVLDSILALPGHRGAQLGDTHELGGQRHVSGEEDPHAGLAGRLDHQPHALGHLRAVGKLADHSDLHVIDDQSDAIRVAHVGQGVGNQKLAAVLHGAPFGPGRRRYWATVVVRSYGSETSTSPRNRLSTGSGIMSGMKHHSRNLALVSGKSSV
jgi:hypothetical protein